MALCAVHGLGQQDSGREKGIQALFQGAPLHCIPAALRLSAVRVLLGLRHDRQVATGPLESGCRAPSVFPIKNQVRLLIRGLEHFAGGAFCFILTRESVAPVYWVAILDRDVRLSLIRLRS